VMPVHVPVKMISPLRSLSPRTCNASANHRSAFKGWPRTIAPLPLTTVTPSSTARTGMAARSWRSQSGIVSPRTTATSSAKSAIELTSLSGTSATTRLPTSSSATKHSATADRNAMMSGISVDVGKSSPIRKPNSHSTPSSPAGIRNVVPLARTSWHRIGAWIGCRQFSRFCTSRLVAPILWPQGTPPSARTAAA